MNRKQALWRVKAKVEQEEEEKEEEKDIIQETLTVFHNGIINEIYDDFESRACDRCKHFNISELKENYCINDESMGFYADHHLKKDDCCNKWEQMGTKVTNGI